MKRLWLLMLCGACATSNQTSPIAASNALPTCPSSRTPASRDDLATVLGRHVDKVCTVGASTDIESMLASSHGRALETAWIGTMLQDLFATGMVRDAEVLATPIDGAGIMLTWFVTPYPAITQIRISGHDATLAKDVNATVTPDQYANAGPIVLRVLGNTVRARYQERGYSRATVQVALTQGEVVVKVDEGTRDDIKNVRFVGVTKAQEKGLRDLLASREDTIFLDTTAANDTEVMVRYFMDHGMVNARSTYVFANGELVFTIRDGDEYKVGNLKLSGVPVRDSERLVKAFESKRNALFSLLAIRRDIERVRTHAIEQGLQVDVLPLTKTDPKKRTIDVTFELVPLTK